MHAPMVIKERKEGMQQQFKLPLLDIYCRVISFSDFESEEEFRPVGLHGIAESLLAKTATAKPS